MQYSGNTSEGGRSFFEKHRRLGSVLALLLLFSALWICWEAGIRHETAGEEQHFLDEPLSEEEYETAFPFLAVTERERITEAAEPVQISPDNEEGIVEITEGGDYELTGRLNGMIHINAKDENVHLFLKNAELNSKSGPAVYCENAARLIITLADGSENTIADSGDYREYSDAEACIYSACDLTFNGSGSLAVYGFYKDAVRSQDAVKLLDGSYVIKCKRTAVQGNDGVVVKDGLFMISSEKYGFRTTKKGTDGRGNLVIAGGEHHLIAGRYAFVTEKADVYLYNCSIESRSVADTFDTGGTQFIQKGCIDER